MGKLVGIFGMAAVWLALGGWGVEGPREKVATCDAAMIGAGPPDWRRRSLAVGPVGVARRPIDEMIRTREGRLLAKMPLVVEGHQPVRVSAPPRLRHRVAISHGRPANRYARSIRFVPCDDQPRTAWPGGIVVKGRKAVSLLVSYERDGETVERLLRLGKPKLLPND